MCVVVRSELFFTCVMKFIGWPGVLPVFGVVLTGKIVVHLTVVVHLS